MCGRYALISSADLLAELFRLADVPGMEPRFNIAPTQDAPVVRMGDDGRRRLDLLRWGLVPSWAEDASSSARTINARSETAAEKPSYRDAFRERRCLVPADAFYEWKKVRRGKQPYAIRRADGAPLAFAGLWDTWRSPDRSPEEVIESFTILTTTPNERLAELHDRMPVILDPGDFETWLDPSVLDPRVVTPLLRPLPADWLTMHPVSTRVNKPANDDAACLEATEATVENATAEDEGMLF